MKVFVTTQMRTGSTWICDILGSIFGIEWEFWANGFKIKPLRFKRETNVHNKKIIKMHYVHPERICEHIRPNDLNNFVISITRDVKDIIISKAFYTKYDRVLPNLNRLNDVKAVRELFANRKLSDKEYINTYIKEGYAKDLIETWKYYNDGYTHPNYLLLTYEELYNNPQKVIKKIEKLLNLELGQARIRKIIQQNSFYNKTGRKSGEGENNAFRRKGIIGDWENYFDEESLKIIEDSLNGIEYIPIKYEPVYESEPEPEPLPPQKDKIFILGGRSGTTLVVRCLRSTGELRMWENKKRKRVTSQSEPAVRGIILETYPKVPNTIFPKEEFDCSKLPEFDFIIPKLIDVWKNPKFIICERPYEDMVNSHIRTGWNKISFRQMNHWDGIKNLLGRPKSPNQFSRAWFREKIRLREEALKDYDQSKILRVKFKDLMNDFKNTMQRVCDFAEVKPKWDEFDKIKKPRVKDEPKAEPKPPKKQGITYSFYTYNMVEQCGEQWIRDSFDSIKDQSDDILVMDYGSTDNIKEIAEEYGFRFIPVERTDGVYFHISKMTNKAIQEAKYDFFVRVTPDAIYPPNMTEVALDFYKNHDVNKFIYVFEYDDTEPIDRPRRGRSAVYYKPFLVKARGIDERTSYFMKEHVYLQQLMYQVFRLRINTSETRLLHRHHGKRERGNPKEQTKVLGGYNPFPDLLTKLSTRFDKFVGGVVNSYW